MTIDGITYRLRNKGEELPRWSSEAFEKFGGKAGAYNAWLASLGGGYVKITGRIGRTGQKVHRFSGTYFTINGERVVNQFDSFCGSQQFGSGLAVYDTQKPVTCQKCDRKAVAK